MQLREDYNSEITIINNERLSMRMEIQRLYNFLKAVGGSMGARITPFDFEKEASVYNEDIVLIEKLEKPELENWHYIDGVVRMSFVKGHNKAIIKDLLSENGGVGEITKTVYNYNDRNSTELEQVSEIMQKSQTKLFTEERSKDRLDTQGKKAYRESRTDSDGDIYDELTGRKGEKSTYIQNGKKVVKSDLQADHVQARESMTYNSRYLGSETVEKLRSFVNSPDNMQMIDQSANASKGDVRVCNVKGQIKYVNARSAEYDPGTDITYKATPE